MITMYMNKATNDERVLQKKINERIIILANAEKIYKKIFFFFKVITNKNGNEITAYSDAKFLMLSVEPGLEFTGKFNKLILKNSNIPSIEIIKQTIVITNEILYNKVLKSYNLKHRKTK